ncbi:motility protein A [Caproiciproducens sp.]|uniref:motility protein A n=1 Tax=Caproiciproducens sp. TaxID=1954376 RepID=UPI00289FA804|nr:motility protein A [Caproiciproducens sp.]
MDFTSIVGLIVGLGLVVFGIVFDPSTGVVWSTIKNFIDVPSMAITFGGAIAATVIAFPITYFKDIPKHMRIIVQRNKYDPQQYINKIVDFAQEARRKGLLSLEDKANQEEEPFLRNSIMLIVDAIDPAKVKEILEDELNGLEDRHSHGWQFYEKFSTFGPAFGMIGTLIGLINMLANMDMNADGGATKMAQGMSTALVTTFYGSMLSNLLLTPLAHKLHMRHDEEMVCKEIVMEGVMAIQAGDNPKHIEERLNAFVCEKKRMESGGKGSSAPENAPEEKKSKRRKK